jgi:uncharacterized protein YkwD
LRISGVSHRSYPLDGQGGGPPPRKSRRAAGLVLGALILLAAFAYSAPYISAALRQGYSIFSDFTNAGNTTTTDTSISVATTSASGVQCSSVVAVKSLVAPDIKNGTANIAYPSDYCTLASYALSLINADRAANGTGPVTLDYNRAAQQHADSMLYYGYFSHFDPQGYKPYMRYTLLGGLGADYENVAYFSYSITHFTTTASVEEALKTLEHSMVYNDSACCNNGHRYNILDKLHNKVSVGVSHSGTFVYFDEEFENDYVNLNLSFTGASSANPYYVTMTGTPTMSTTVPTSIYIALDSTPTPESIAQLNSGPHEYGPGTLVGGVLPRSGPLGCGEFTTGTTVCADTWKFSSNQVNIAFSLQPFIKAYGHGVYTVYLITGSSTNSAITTISLFVP